MPEITIDDLIDKLALAIDCATDETPCHCTECSWKGYWYDCAIEWESDGWEYPKYKVAFCPKCGGETEVCL